MMFCPKCGSLLLPKKDGKKTVMHCKCGYKSKDKAEATIKEEVKNKASIKGVADGDFETLPLTEIECPKCKHKKAYFCEVQTRAADEAPTKFLKCEKCKHIWRDYN
jgi:transcription factor S